MVKDVTLGQFFPGKSFIHRLDPRIKLCLLIVWMVMIFLCKNFWALGVVAGMTVLCQAVSRISPKFIFKGLKMLIFVIIFTSLLQIFYNDDGTVLLEWWKIKVTTGGVFTALFMAIRIVCLILISSLLTYTTSPTLLTDGIERLLSPLNKLHVPVHTFAMMMTIALRFIPTLVEEVDRIMSAQKARADMETGGVVKRAKALVPVFVPLFVNSFRRAFELAYAMECRCYHGGEGRTRLRVMKLGIRDFAAFVIVAAMLAGVILLNYYFKHVI